MKLRIYITYLIILTVAFILCTVVGTISHEYGHIVVAKYFGYETTLHYGSMSYYPKGYLEDEDLEAFNTLTKDYWSTDYKTWPDSVKEKVTYYRNILHDRYWKEKSNISFYVSLGGPVQTLLTGTAGLFILFFRRTSIRNKGLQWVDWVAVFLGLFWLREIFNLVHSVSDEILFPDGRWFGGDEFNISIHLNLWPGTVPILLGTLGLFLSSFIVFKIVPRSLRLTFIVSGLIGGLSGFILWMDIIGPKILP